MKSKTFAFRLQTKNEKQNKPKQWKAKEGVAAAGCTDPSGHYDFRYNSSRYGIDGGVYC